MLRSTWHRISRLYNTEAAKHDFTMSVGQVLLNIDSKKGTPSTKLGPAMGMEATSLTRILKSMETKGLIERKPDPDDGRMVRIFLTDTGRQKRQIAREKVLRFNEIVQLNTEPKELKAFFKVLDNINLMIEQQEIFEDEKND